MSTKTAPKALTEATDLIEHARANGWNVVERWTPPGYQGPSTLTVLIGHAVRSGPPFLYHLAWTVDGKRSDQGQERTPTVAQWRRAPAAKAIRSVIAVNPVHKHR
ncbi:hypothetical protein ACWEFD_31740 [Streptomyces ardesiacus]